MSDTPRLDSLAARRRALLVSLLARISSAERGSDELDRQVYCIVHGWESITFLHGHSPRYYVQRRTTSGSTDRAEVAPHEVLSYTSSLDDALHLIHSALPGWGVLISLPANIPALVCLSTPDESPGSSGTGPTPALAALVALFMACLQRQAPEDSHE